MAASQARRGGLEWLKFMIILDMMNKSSVYLRQLGQEHSLAMHTIVCLGA